MDNTLLVIPSQKTFNQHEELYSMDSTVQAKRSPVISHSKFSRKDNEYDFDISQESQSPNAKQFDRHLEKVINAQ